MAAYSAHEDRPLGWWRPSDSRPEAGSASLGRALRAINRSAVLVRGSEGIAAATGGEVVFGARPEGEALPLLGMVPPLHPEDLGDGAFRRLHGVRYAYVVGAMANGIASVDLVVAMARARMLAFFGAAGLAPSVVASAVQEIRSQVEDGLPWGVNLIHSPSEPELEAEVVQILLDHGVSTVSASAYLDLTLPVVRYRVHGIHEGSDGRVVTPNRVLAKVSRTEVAKRFLSPPPERFLKQLLDLGEITPEQAVLARRVPMAEDITAESDSGGHTDNRPLVVLLPRLAALRDELTARNAYAVPPRIGAAGGLGTPSSIAAAFGLGAAYVVTGSINQSALEAGTSDHVRKMLAQADTTDVTMAPAADMFEMGVDLQVLSRGTMFPVRARKLYEIYKRCDGLHQLSEAEVAELEKSVFRASLEESWSRTEAFWSERDPTQITRALNDPKHRMALLFRSYLGLSSRWANAGQSERAADFQIWCGPAMGAFNAWAAQGRFADWSERRAVPMARCLLVGASVAARAAALRAQGVSVPSAAEACPAMTDLQLDALLESEWAEARSMGHGSAREAISSREAQGEPIAIVGMDCLFPEAGDLRSFQRNVRLGVDAITEVPDRPGYWRKEDYLDPDPSAPDMLYTARGGFLDPVDFDPTEFGIPPTILEATDTSQLLGLYVAARALRDAGYGPGVSWDKDRASVILGVTGTQELVVNLGARLGHPKWRAALQDAGVDEETTEDVVRRIAASYVGWQESSFPGLLGNVVAGRIANRLDLGGTNCVIDAACASSLGAVEMAVMELRQGRSDVVLTGGVDALNDVFMYQCFTATPALSKTGDARPFDADGDGTILGEGIGILVLKRLSDAQRDGDRVRAVLTGIGSSSDGRAKSIYAPRSSGQARAIRDAHRDAGVSPSDIGLLEAHGTGTKAGDATEVAGLEEVFRRDELPPGTVPLGSIKSMVGHTKAAAGAAGLIKAALALEHKVLPPTLKVRAPLPSLADGHSPLVLNTTARPWVRRGEVRRAGVSAFGFGGSNFHAILEEVARDRSEPSWDGSVQLLPVGATNGEDLASALRTLAASDRDLAELAARAREDFQASEARAVLVIHCDEDWRARIHRAAALAVAGNNASTPDGTRVGFGAPSGELALLFAGQGSQRVGMGAELACIFPEVLAELDADPSLAALVHAPAVWDEEARTAQKAVLRRTDHAQPALAALEAGMLDVLRRFEVKPSAVAGHSFGELTALHAAGVFDRAGLRAASRARGSLMAGDGEDRGTMLAMLAPLADCAAAVEKTGQGLVLANLNAPSQSIASGTRAAIDSLSSECAKRGVRTKSLEVGAAFHSPLVAEAEVAFASALAGVAFDVPTVPVIANSTGAPYPSDPVEARELLASQLARPVRWVEAVEALVSQGVTTFVEVGPGATLTGLVGQILGEHSHLAIAMDGNARQGGLWSLGWTLAQLAAEGYPVALRSWERVSQPPRTNLMKPHKQRMAVPLGGANHRDPVTPIPPRAPRPSVARPPVATAQQGPPMSNDPHSAALVAQALHGAQEQLRALQSMQEQTAATHRAFLDGQASAQASFQALLDGQQRLIEQMVGLPSRAPAAPAHPVVMSSPRPAPISVPNYAPTAVPGFVSGVGASQSAPPPPPARAYAPVASVPQLAPEPVAVASVPSPARASSGPDVVETLLMVVADATGYPTDMLELDMDLESDLGIDSIKRVEILSMLTERLPEAPAVEPERLSALQTLRQVAAFVSGTSDAGTSDAAEGLVQASPPSAAASSAAPTPEVDPAQALVEVVAEATGYPTDMLDLDMDLESDLGIDSIKRVEILSMLTERLPNTPVVEPENLGSLATLRQVLDFVTGSDSNVQGALPSGPPEASPPEPTESVPEALPERRALSSVPFVEAAADRPLPLSPGDVVWVVDDGSDLVHSLSEALRGQGLEPYLVHAQSEEIPAPSGLVVTGTDLPLAFSILRTAGPHLEKAANAGGGMLVSISRLDGGFGTLDGSLFTNDDALSAGLAGLVKTAAWEWPDLWCRALDLSADVEGDAHLVEWLLAELRSAGPIEVGRDTRGLRRRLMLQEVGAPESSAERVSGLVIVTGGARGVTAECAVALARGGAEGLLLLGRSPSPKDEPEWLHGVDNDGVQAAVLAHGYPKSRPSPKQLRTKVSRILAAREIASTLRRVEEAGAVGRYASVDVRDADGVAKAVKRAERSTKLKVRGVLHGAGVLRDKLIGDKSDEDVDVVLGTKIEGLRSVLAAVSGRDLDFLGLFASVTGRFGRRGQSDYACANRVLDAMGVREASRRPGTRVVSWSWGPWDGGMVTPDLKKAFAREGVALIPRTGGAEVCLSEVLAYPDRACQIVVGDGLDAQNGSSDPPPVQRPLRLSVEQWPALADHMLDGVPVLPFALAMEFLAREAVREFPGMRLAGLDDVRVLQGVRLDREVLLTPRLSGVVAGPEQVSVTVDLVDETGRARVRGVAVLQPAEQPSSDVPEAVEWPDAVVPWPGGQGTVYGQALFHGPAFQGIRSVHGTWDSGIAVTLRPGPDIAEWNPPAGTGAWLVDPLVVDGVFQAMILWCRAATGAPSLPSRIARMRFYRDPTGDDVRVVATVRRRRGNNVLSDVDILDSEGQLLARIDGYTCTAASSLEAAFRPSGSGSTPAPPA